MEVVNVPGSGAVAVKDVEVLAGEQLAAIHARLNGAEASQNSHLLDVAHQRHDVKSLQLGVHRVQAADKMLEEELEGLRQAQHRLALYHECSHLLAAIVDELALVGGGIGAADWWRTVIGARRDVMMRRCHQIERTRVVHERVKEAEAVGREVREALCHSRLHPHQTARR